MTDKEIRGALLREIYDLSSAGNSVDSAKLTRLGLDGNTLTRYLNELDNLALITMNALRGDAGEIAAAMIKLTQKGVRSILKPETAPHGIIMPVSPASSMTPGSRSSSLPKKVVVPLHGIRTHADWQREFVDVAQQNGLYCPLRKWSFGYFSIVRFFLPRQREAKVRWFRSAYDDLKNSRDADLGDNNLPSVIAHSFGTYILGYALLKYRNIRLDKVILCGSILPRTFPWKDIIERGQIRELRNEYGVRDIWVTLVKWFVKGAGSSGQNGFTENGFKLQSDRITQEQFIFDHGEYFNEGHMNDFWMPFLLRASTPAMNPDTAKTISFPSSHPPFGLYSIYLIIVLGLVFGVGDFRKLLVNWFTTAYKDDVQDTKMFSQSMAKLYSEKKEESIGGIVSLSQLAQTNANWYWRVNEALTAYIRTTAPLDHIRRTFRNRNPQYRDPPESNVPEQEFDYERVNDIPPANTLPQIGAQLALKAIGNRNVKFEKRSDTPAPQSDTGCQREHIINQLHGYLNDLTFINNDREAVNYEIIIETPPLCFTLLNGVSNREWINFPNSRFVAMKLEKVSLEGANLVGSDFSFSELVFAQLARTKYTSGSLVGANLWGADLREADFRWADVRGANLGRANLRLAWMSGGNFSRANFFEAHLENASLIGTDMEDVQTMGGSYMDNVIGFRANFTKAHIGGGKRVSMKGAYLVASIFKDANLHSVDLRNTDFQSADLSGADLSDADLSRADLRNANVIGASFSGARLTDTDCRGSDLTQAVGLTSEQIAYARVDQSTKLPQILAHTDSKQSQGGSPSLEDTKN